MAILTRQQLIENIEAMEAQGAPQADIQEYVNSQPVSSSVSVQSTSSPSLSAQSTPRETQSKSFLRPKELLSSFRDISTQEAADVQSQISDAKSRLASGEQGLGRTAFTIGSQGAQLGLSTGFRSVGNVLSAALPDFIEDPIRRKLGDKTEDFLGSEQGQQTVDLVVKLNDAVDTLEPKNQQLVRDVADTLLSGVDVVSGGVAGQVTRRGATQVGRQAGEKGASLLRQAEKDAADNAQAKLVDLITDTSTPTKRASIAGRTTEGGFFSGRTVNPSSRDLEIVNELVTTPGIKVNRSALFNVNALSKEIRREAEALTKAIEENNFIFPKKEANARLVSVAEDLKATNPNIVGDAEKMADRVFAKMQTFIEANEGTAAGALKARKEFDRYVTSNKPKAFDKEDNYNTIVREARRTVNDFIEEKAIDVDVKKSLQRQSRLLEAQDVLKTKAGKESTTGFVRALDRATEALGTKNRVVQLLATAVGIGGLGAAATFAPAVAAVGGVTIAANLITKALKSPTSRKALAKALLAIEKALPKAKGEEKTILNELKDELTTLLDKDIPVGLTVLDVSKESPRFKELTSTISRLNSERDKLIARGLKENSPAIKANEKATLAAINERAKLGE